MQPGDVRSAHFCVVNKAPNCFMCCTHSMKHGEFRLLQAQGLSIDHFPLPKSWGKDQALGSIPIPSTCLWAPACCIRKGSKQLKSTAWQAMAWPHLPYLSNLYRAAIPTRFQGFFLAMCGQHNRGSMRFMEHGVHGCGERESQRRRKIIPHLPCSCLQLLKM